jgi:exopolysaccharide biosynthesis polyprenyl glycosylphosphotransferase
MSSTRLQQRAPTAKSPNSDLATANVAKGNTSSAVALESPAPARARSDTLRADARTRHLLLVADVLASAIAVLAAALVGTPKQITAESALVVLLAPALAKILGLYDRDQSRLRKSTLDELPTLLQFAGVLVFVAWIVTPRAMGGLHTPHGLAIFVAILLASLTFSRASARRLVACITPAERCLFVGPADEAMRFGSKLECDRGTNAKLVAQIDLHDAPPWTSSSVSDHALANARELVRRLGIQRVIIAPQSLGGTDILDLMRTFGAIGTRVSVIPALLQVVGSAVEFDDVHGVAMLGVRGFSLPRSSRLVKRAFDLVAAAALIVIFSPLLACVALAIKLDSPGAVLFRQERVGRGGHVFKLFKFRSMVADAEARKNALGEKNQAADGFFKIPDDPRITRTGRVLRRTNLDELPQVLNVLRGEMSLVGPRPLIPQEDQRVVGWHRRRLELTPGMTGHWQVLGSSRVPLDEMVAIDYLYVANWSLWADLKLLLRTVPHVLGGRGL